jgi:hypothetical protein
VLIFLFVLTVLFVSVYSSSIRQLKRDMDLSRCHNGGLASGIVFPRHPTSPPLEMLSKNGGGKSDSKNGTGSINPKTSFFSISNLVNGLRQQQEKGKTRKI